MRLITTRSVQSFVSAQSVILASELASKQPILVPFLITSVAAILCQTGYWYAYDHSYTDVKG